MDVPELYLAGVVDPARYSDRAVVIVEVETDAYLGMTPADVDAVIDSLKRELGMRVQLIVGARLARIEEPADG